MGGSTLREREEGKEVVVKIAFLDFAVTERSFHGLSISAAFECANDGIFAVDWFMSGSSVEFCGRFSPCLSSPIAY